MVNFIHSQIRKILLSALLTLFFLALILGGQLLGYTVNSADESQDMLAYSLSNYDGISLMLYDPHHSMRAPLLPDGDFGSFSFSADGRMAFSSWDGSSYEVYMLDALSPSTPPVNISQNPVAGDFPLAWSPDGRYLAFGSNDDDANRLLYVWDGNAITNITPNDLENMVAYYVPAWSLDGRLAFTVQFNLSPTDRGDPSEIYLWDGHATTNLSQNPTSGDGVPIWNSDGRVVWLSRQDEEGHVVAWDGESFQDDSPHLEFINVPPELTAYYSYPTWTPNGHLAFLAQTMQDSHVQIYVWDGRTATNISQNPTLHNGSPTWSADGRWAFVTFLSSQQLLYVRDTDNHTLLTVEGQYMPAWSSSGYLAFCQPGWVLSVWDGQQIIEVTHVTSGGLITAQWQGGAGVVCTSG